MEGDEEIGIVQDKVHELDVLGNRRSQWEEDELQRLQARLSSVSNCLNP